MTAGDSGEDNKSTLDMKMSNPAGRPGADADMAASILFLAGPGGVFYNEQILFPDGGMLTSPNDRYSADMDRQYPRAASCEIETTRPTVINNVMIFIAHKDVNILHVSHCFAKYPWRDVRDREAHSDTLGSFSGF